MENSTSTLVYELFYGNWDVALVRIRSLLNELPAEGMENIRLFVNNNLYNLEFYVGAGFDLSSDIGRFSMARFESLMKELGGKSRSSFTHSDLVSNILHDSNQKRFNVTSLPSPESVDKIIDGSEGRFASRSNDVGQEKAFFLFPPASAFRKMEWSFRKDMGMVPKVFISHQGDRKEQARELKTRLNSFEIATWFDEDQIDYGDELIEKIDDGIKNCDAVIFWISAGFVESNWCRREMIDFLTRNVTQNKKGPRIFTVIDGDVDTDDLPSSITSKKYLKLNKSGDVDELLEKLLGPLVQWKNNQQFKVDEQII